MFLFHLDVLVLYHESNGVNTLYLAVVVTNDQIHT